MILWRDGGGSEIPDTPTETPKIPAGVLQILKGFLQTLQRFSKRVLQRSQRRVQTVQQRLPQRQSLRKCIDSVERRGGLRSGALMKRILKDTY